ncbi:MAG TPA: DUF6569 family protein [Methylomirabilota bacterium]|nr:DUF6569 family protein [Methylomirabilota bacterium]
MTTSRREVLWVVGLAAVGGMLVPGQAGADRLRILDGPAAAGLGADRSPELERLVGMLTLGDTRQRGALSIVWLHALAAAPALDVATLDEAHAAGSLVVTERERAAVPDLIVDNRGKRAVLLLAGEILLGGKQHRVLAEDVLLPPRSGPRSIGVYCVEAGRWSGTSERLESKGTFAPPRLRSEVLDRADQQRVWSAVSQYAARAAAASPTQSYEAVVEQPEVREHLRHVEDDLGRPPAGSVGAAAFTGARLAGLDVFQNASLFGRLWPKLLRAHAVETHRRHVQAGVGPSEHERRLHAALGATQRAHGGSRRNVGEGAIFEFRVDGLRGAALTVRDQVLHLAVV